MTDSIGKTALVTGASSGIGLAIADLLLEDGFALTIASSSRDRIEEAAHALGDAHAVQGDVSIEGDCERIISAHRRRFGRLDVLVNSAGILRQSDIADLALADWERQFAVNVTGAFLVTRLALPMLRVSRGLIVNIASIAGKFANPGMGLGAYGATKAAMISLTQSLNAELEPDGVRALAICPGFVDTPMAGFSSLPGEQMIQPADVAEVVRMALRLSPHARVAEVVIEVAIPEPR
jgi:NAD(P)-dependent dehydrogenase (short-subunit alcohol dehydrogenase family)